MICFMDKTFCKDKNCSCDFTKFTDDMKERAEKWWNPQNEPDKKGQAPICFVMHNEETKNERR